MGHRPPEPGPASCEKRSSGWGGDGAGGNVGPEAGPGRKSRASCPDVQDAAAGAEAASPGASEAGPGCCCPPVVWTRTLSSGGHAVLARSCDDSAVSKGQTAG